MMQESVRELGLEERVLHLLGEDRDKLWNVAGLVRQFGVSRGKVERAVLALSVLERVKIEKPVGNSWVVRLPPVVASAPADSDAKKPKNGRSN